MNRWLIEFKVNGTSYTVLKLLGEGGYSQVLPGFWYLWLVLMAKKIQFFLQMWSGVRGVQCRQGNFRLEDRQLEGVHLEDVQLKQHNPFIYMILTNSHAVKVFRQMECSVEMKGELIREILFLEKMKNFRHVVIFFWQRSNCAFNWLRRVPGKGFWIWD